MEDRTIHSLPGFRGEIGVWMWCLEDARRRTLNNLLGASQAELDWQADPTANTIGSLLYHMAAIETSYVFEDVLGGVEFPAILESLLSVDVRAMDGSLSSVTGETLVAHLDRLATCRQLLVKVYQDMPADHFHTPIRLESYEISPAWVLHHLMQHEAEHRGQIEEIRRLFAHFNGQYK